MYQVVRFKNATATFANRDPEKGIIGKIENLAPDMLLFQTENREDAISHIKCLLHENNETLALCENENILGLFRHDALDHAVQLSKERRRLINGLLFILAINCLFSIVILKAYLLAPLLIFLLSLIYYLFVRFKIQNSIESAVVITIISILAWAHYSNFLWSLTRR